VLPPASATFAAATAAIFLLAVPQVYSQLEEGSHVVNTAWAMMALLAAGWHTIDPKPLHK
jgi:cycloartenol synthase